MSRREFWLWVAGTVLFAVVIAVWLSGCNAAKVAESAEVGVGHSAGTLDWSNSQRSADTQSNSVWLSVHPFAGAFDEPRDPVWGDLHYPREQPDVVQPESKVVGSMPQGGGENAPAPTPPPSAPPESWGAAEWGTIISAVVVGLVGLWQRQNVMSGVKKLVGRKAKDEE